MVREGEKRIVYCSHFIPALPKQNPSKIFSNITPACQKNSREQNRDSWVFFPSVWISTLETNQKKKKNLSWFTALDDDYWKNIFLFSWKCHNSFGIDQPGNETILAEGHEPFRDVITYFQVSGLIIVTNP